MSRGLSERVGRVVGRGVRNLAPMGGGCVGEVYLARLEGGERVVVKTAADASARLEREGYMLRYLRERSRLPVPGVLHAEDTLLVMEYVESSGGLSGEGQRGAAELLADLHGITAERYGLERDTLIGGLDQPNGWMESWVGFFRERRLGFMAAEAERAGRLPGRLRGRVEALGERLGELIPERPAASLLHGDVWSGNVLARDGRVAALIDPAIYYGHDEVELAFITLFSTFSSAFFERYGELRGIDEGFFDRRCAVYNLFPLLVHVRLFGGHYVGSVEQTLRRLGF